MNNTGIIFKKEEKLGLGDGIMKSGGNARERMPQIRTDGAIRGGNYNGWVELVF